MTTWIDIPTNSDFSLYNLPYGIFMRDEKPTPGVAIGDSIIDLNACAKVGLLADLGFDTSVFEADVLNDFIACGKDAWSALRSYLTEQLSTQGKLYEFREKVVVSRIGTQMCMPVKG